MILQQKQFHFCSVFQLYSRYSFLAQYMIVEIATGKQTPLSTASNQQNLQLAAWGPENNSIIYIFKNNIYFRPTVQGGEIQITGDGEQGRIYNGIPDWVYEGLLKCIQSQEKKRFFIYLQRKFWVQIKHFGFRQKAKEWHTLL